MQKGKTRKRFIIKILFLLFSVTIIHFYLFYSHSGYKCLVEGGKKVWINGLDISVCIVKTNDYGKYCDDGFSCDGYCIIKNKDILEKKWVELFGNETNEVNAEEFEKKAQIKIEGYCSKFRAGSSCGDENEIFNVESGLIKKKIRSGWNLPTIDCDNYFED